MGVRHHLNLKSNKRKIVFVVSPWELVFWILFTGGQRNSFREEFEIFVKGNRLLSCAAFARKRLCSVCSTSAQPRPSCAFFSRMSVRPSTHRVVTRLHAARTSADSIYCWRSEGAQQGGAGVHTHTHTHTHTARRSHIVLKKWRGRSGGGHSPTTERERRNNGDSEEEGLLRVARGWVWWGRS